MSETLDETEQKPRVPRLAWGLTGSGHDFEACLELIRRLGPMDVFVSRAAAEVIFMYTKDRAPFPPGIRVIRDTSASAAPVGRFYHGWYHTLVVAPATSNTSLPSHRFASGSSEATIGGSCLKSPTTTAL